MTRTLQHPIQPNLMKSIVFFVLEYEADEMLIAQNASKSKPFLNVKKRSEVRKKCSRTMASFSNVHFFCRSVSFDGFRKLHFSSMR